MPIFDDMRRPLTLVHIALAGLFLLLRGMAAFAAPPLDSHVVLAGRGQDSATAALEARNKLLVAADTYRGTPYRYGGLDRNGLDCSGFIYLSFKDSLAVSVPRTTTTLYSWAEKIDANSLQPGDLVFFITTGRNISHAGLYTGDGQFIHAASDGPHTGVIYSRLDESYWQKTFAGAGRALPEASASAWSPVRGANASGGAAAGSTTTGATTAGSVAAGGSVATGGTGALDKGSGGLKGKGFMLGVGFAPTWNGFLDQDSPLRGVALQARFAWKGDIFGLTIIPGFEIRPEWDDTLGVFRVPLTLSLGFDDRVRFFFGPAVTLGSPLLKSSSGNRQYTGGSSWFGAAGITVAPLSIPVSKGALDIYGEFAWQSYNGDINATPNSDADMGVRLRFSTGVRYTWDL